MRMPKLTDEKITEGMQSLPEWARVGDEIRRTFVFAGFAEAVAFVVKVAIAAEKADHHPDIDIRWNKVTLALTTHDSGGITGNDLALALQADAL